MRKKFDIGEDTLLQLGNYKIDDFKYFNMLKNKEYQVKYSRRYTTKEENIYNIENELSINDKLKVIDMFTNGFGTYTINLIKLFNADLANGNIKKDKCGYSINRNSFNKWKRINDIKDLVCDYNSRTYYAFGNEHSFNGNSLICRSNYDYYNDQDIIHQWFQDLIHRLIEIERIHFEKTDGNEIKVTKLEDMMISHWLSDGIEDKNPYQKRLWEQFYCVGTNTRDIKIQNMDLTNKVFEVYSDFNNKVKDLREEAEKEINKIAKENI